MMSSSAALSRVGCGVREICALDVCARALSHSHNICLKGLTCNYRDKGVGSDQEKHGKKGILTCEEVGGERNIERSLLITLLCLLISHRKQ